MGLLGMLLRHRRTLGQWSDEHLRFLRLDLAADAEGVIGIACHELVGKYFLGSFTARMRSNIGSVLSVVPSDIHSA